MSSITRRALLERVSIFLPSLLLTKYAFSEELSENLSGIFPKDFSGKMVSVTDYMSDEQIKDINSSSPTLDHSDALRKALSISKVVYIPAVKGFYKFKDVDLEDGVWLIGSSKLPYYPKSIKDIKGCGSAIVMTEGGRSIFKFNNNVTLFGIVLFGDNNRTIDSIVFSNPKSGKLSNLRFLYCGFYSFRVGIGSLTKYIKIDVTNCISASNNFGIRNIVDSKVIGGSINGNYSDGVFLDKGANDNIFMNVKVEWNSGRNFVFQQAINNIISASICDRAGKQGISILKSQVIIDSCVIRRNGAKLTEQDMSCHIYVEGPGTTVLIKGSKTLVGKNDDRSGILSPSHSIIFGGNDNRIKAIISDNDLSGSILTSILYKIKPIDIAMNNNILN